MNSATSDYYLELIYGTGRRVLFMEYHGAYLLPLLCHDVVPGTRSLQFLLFLAETSQHVDETLVITNGLILKILISWITLLF